MGANTSILDACALGKAIIGGVQQRQDLDFVLRSYEDIMIPRGREHVLASHATGEESSSAHEIAGGRLDVDP